MAKGTLRITRQKKRLRSGPPLPTPVTVIVLTWNAVEETIELINSIYEKPLPSNAELLFVDNGSKDYTVDLLMRYDEVEIILNEKNLGFPKAVNKGIAWAKGDVVLLNNDTTILQQDWIHLMQETAYSRPDAGPVGCRLISKSGDKVLHAGGWLNPHILRGGNITCELDERREIIPCGFVCFGCVYLKRSLLNACGPLCEEYFAYCEDVDYCLNARLLGYVSLMDGRVNLMHRQSGSRTPNESRLDVGMVHLHSEMIFKDRWKHKIELIPTEVLSAVKPLGLG